jgi:hypothetical protein
LDLAIIGGYFADKKRADAFGAGADGGGAYGPSDWTDHIGVFLVGIIKKID